MSSSSARGEESPPQSREDADQVAQPVSREDKKKNPKSDIVKTKLAAILSNTFHNGNAFEAIAASTPTQIAACFPSVKTGRLAPGSVLTPSADTLQDKLASALTTSEQVPKGIENAPPDAVRDTVLAGALIGSSEVLEGCLKNGADLTLRDSDGRHILHYLGVTGNASLLRKVLRRLEKTHGGRNGSKHKKGDAPAETFAQLLNSVDNHGWTPLSMAIARGNEEAVDAFLAYPELQLTTHISHSCPPSLITQTVQSGPLHIAAMGGHVSLVFRLLERGCQIEETDSHGRNIYHYVAALNGYATSLGFLDGVAQHQKFVLGGLTETDLDGRTPIFVSIAHGNLALSERLLFLLRQQATSPHEGAPGFASHHLLRKDNFGMTALHLAMMRKHHTMLFRIGRLWSTFSGHKDLSSLIEGLGGSPSDDCLIPLLLSSLEPMWILKDLSHSEQVIFDVVQSGFKGADKSNADKTSEAFVSQLAKAVRFCGQDNVLKCFRMALDMDARGEVMMAAPDRRRTVLGIFYKILSENTPTHLWTAFLKNDAVINACSIAAVRPHVNASAPIMPRQTQSVNRHLKAPGFAGPRAGSGLRSSSVSGGIPSRGPRRDVPSSPRVPPMTAHTHTLPISPNTGRRGTVTATTTRPAPQSMIVTASTSARGGPSFAMPTKSVVLRGGRVERAQPAALRSASRTLPPQRGSSSTAMTKPSPPPRAAAKGTLSQQGSVQMSDASEPKENTAPVSTETPPNGSSSAHEDKQPGSLEEVYAC